MDFKNNKFLVVGMAKSGVASAVLLCKLEANVTIYDIKTKENLPKGTLDPLKNYTYNQLLGEDIIDKIQDFDVLVLSPGVPMGLPFIKKAIEFEKNIISEIELGFSVSKADFIAITGTNGKTTTTALTGEIFKKAGKNTFVLGNIGVPITQEALNTHEGDVVVAETAALQLDAIVDYKPKESAILNITEDHLDRYKTMENYTAAKARIFKNQTEEDFCVLNYDNEIVRGLQYKIKAKVVWFSVLQKVEGAYVEGDNIVFEYNGKKSVILPCKELNIPGKHNLENALAATALAALYDIPTEVIAQTLREFKGVEHRIEFVRTLNGVTFINDSKGTNPDATINAIKAMEKPTVLILGGYDKKNDFVPLFSELTKYIKAVIVLGDTTNKIITAAKQTGYENYIKASTFEDGVLKAYSLAEKGDTVLLSPACASYDMFENFEQRGEVFKEIVNKLQ